MSFEKFSILLLLTLAVISFIFVSTSCHQSDRFGNINIIDETDKWVQHKIYSNIPRGNGSLAIADINGDQKIDILFCLGIRNTPKSSDGIYWLEGPNWALRRISNPSTPIRWSLSLSTDDIDNDGDIDVVALSFDNSNVYLALNPLSQGGDINEPWPTKIILNSPGIRRDGERVELTDIDQDGYKDVIFLRGKPPEVHILFNPTEKIADSWEDKIVGIHGGSDAHDVYTADVDLDGDLDIITASGDQTWKGSVFWFENPNGLSKEKGWRRHKISSHNANFGGLQIADVNQDSFPDILVTESHGTPGHVMWYQNPILSSKKQWRQYKIDQQNFPHAGLLFDVNGDGKKEYWVPDATHDGRKKGGIVYYQLIDAKNNQWSKHIVAYPPEVGRQCYAYDMDNDGDLDVISTAELDKVSKMNSIVWWENKMKDNL